MKHSRQTRGFTLLELLAVVTIIGIIAAVAMSRVSHQALDAKKKVCWQYKSDINAAIERYRFDYGTGPATIHDLEGEYYPDVIPKCPVTNVDYEIDATAGRVLGHEH